MARLNCYECHKPHARIKPSDEDCLRCHTREVLMLKPVHDSTRHCAELPRSSPVDIGITLTDLCPFPACFREKIVWLYLIDPGERHDLLQAGVGLLPGFKA